MILNQANLTLLNTGFKANFKDGLGMVQPMWGSVATMVPSSTAAEHYAWLGQWPRLREWIGDRVLKSITNHDYTIRNKDFEVTVTVPRNAITDDIYGVYLPMMTEMGSSATTHPDEVVFAALENGFTSRCYDGQNFFDTDHPVGLPGQQTTVSNMQPGDGLAWYLLDTRRSLKPLIYQRRQPYDFVAKFDPRNSDHVFFNKEFVYGVDGRLNAGYGFWQTAAASRAPLTPQNFRDLYQGMTLLKSDEGRPLGLKPTVLVYGNKLQWQASALIDTTPNAVGTGDHYDSDKARRVPKTAGGGGDPEHHLHHLHPDADHAQHAADAASKQFKRKEQRMTAETWGQPWIHAGSLFSTQGFGDDDDRQWTMVTCEHLFGGKGDMPPTTRASRRTDARGGANW